MLNVMNDIFDGSTLYTGSYGFGNLGDELCLLDTMKRFPSKTSHVVSRQEYVKNFVNCDELIVGGPFNNPKYGDRFKYNKVCNFDRIILGGGLVLGTNSSPDTIRTLYWAWKNGVETIIYNVGVGGVNFLTGQWFTPSIRQFLEEVEFSVRDELGRLLINERWPLSRSKEIEITYFTESEGETDFSLAESILPAGKKLLGISMVHSEAHLSYLREGKEAVTNLLSRYEGYTVVPIVSTMHSSYAVGASKWATYTGWGNDAQAFTLFAEMFLDGFKIVGTEMLDINFWYKNMSPQKLKGVISSCDCLISQRKHNCVNAITHQIPNIFLGSKEDDSITRTWDALKDRVHPDSHLMEL
jgi:hypothetical protein